jgi:hypothetical protein
MHIGILLALTLWQTTIAAASPLGASASGTPGSSANTIPAGSSSSSSNQTGSFEPSIRGTETTLAVFSSLLLIATYATLISPGTRLQSTSKLPLSAIAENVSALLSESWPDKSTSARLGPSEVGDHDSDAIRLMYVGQMTDEKNERRCARGVEQSKAVPDKKIDTQPMWLTTGSTLTRCMVQLAVWEWVSIWMAIAMICATLTFNGFFSNERRPDSFPRLVVVLIYTVAFGFHALYTSYICKSFLTWLGAGATWSMLNKASFASVDLGQLQGRLEAKGPSPIFKHVGKPASSSTFPEYDAVLVHEAMTTSECEQPGETKPAAEPRSSNKLKDALGTVTDWQRAEVSSCVEAGKVALERCVTNLMTMVAIIVTSGFSVWTSQANSESSQLGSLALLASLSLGTGAMFSSGVELSVMDTSFKNLLFLKEIMINGKASEHILKRTSKTRIIGFTHGTVKARPVLIRDLAKVSGFWGFLLFGPAYALLPTKDDHARLSAGVNFELNVKVRNKAVIFTTEGTSAHSKDGEGENVEAINVCYIPPPPPPPPPPSDEGRKPRGRTVLRRATT